MARIYTKTGDKGETGLVGGGRISKDSPRVQAYGDIDELNSVLGMVEASMKQEELRSLIEMLQRDLFTAGADLACITERSQKVPRITADMITTLERSIDKLQKELPPLSAFILPGGGQTGALLHFARCVARRAERNIVALSKAEPVNEQLIPYVNRLSDLLFVMARLVNYRDGQQEVEWHQKA